MTEQHSCPLCGALPCDWVGDPHAAHAETNDRLHRAKMIIAALKDYTSLTSSNTIFGKSAADWKHKAIEWLLEA